MIIKRLEQNVCIWNLIIWNIAQVFIGIYCFRPRIECHSIKDENVKVGAVLYVSNAFGIVNHMLLLAKLKAYGIQPTALKQTAFILQAAMKGQCFKMLTVRGLK